MNSKGHLHPATQLTREIISIFDELGFSIATGPEMEHEYYNFDALNVSKDHPSRDMQDTFWIKGGERTLLATQTSAIQIRYMEKNKPPFRIIAPGKVYRNEATDATHEVQFTQLEGLMVDKNVTLAELKGVLEHMMKKLFGENVAIRFRPSYFPFVEPAVEVDMKWKDTWLEMGGAGMVHPNVLRAVNLDPQEWNGFAFGFGIDRMIMLKYGIDDIRHLYTGDLRFVNQF
ncbi:MAG: phenylalanine--tRNA ligase subunit alpha [Candidatus Pacebacteria bacterium]|jgi:phenylalanyl-tRNA synthetase alpha chain|nr:phenylalanine--tRNA ligase subunit alpha [Candidatus Paceibacterota bacterium]